MESSNTNKDLELILASIDQAKNTKDGEEGKREEDTLVLIPNLDTLDKEANEVKIDEIMKELKSLKKQNQITHCLISVLIVVTAVWQLSEVSLFLSVKEMVANPVKSLGDFVLGGFNGKRKNRAATEALEALAIPPVIVPELPRVEIPLINLSGGNEE